MRPPRPRERSRATSRHRPSPGRPRDATRDTAIHEATLDLLRELGYERLSIGSIADRAGVSKATIYRRWSGKAAVVASAVEHERAASPPRPRGESLRDDLLAALAWLARQIAEGDMALLAAVLAGMRSDPELASAMRDRLHRDEAAMIEETLRAAADRGVGIRSGAGELFVEIAPAVIVHRLLVVGAPCDAPFLAHLVDDVLLPLLRDER